MTLNRSSNLVSLTKKVFCKQVLKFKKLDILCPVVLYLGRSVTENLVNGRFVSWTVTVTGCFVCGPYHRFTSDSYIRPLSKEQTHWEKTRGWDTIKL